jgi:hypothetical protein
MNMHVVRFLILALSLGVLPGASSSAFAGFSEPPIVVYGKVTNKVGRQSQPIFGGTMSWTITSGKQAVPIIVETQLETLPGGYSYRLEIPVHKIAGKPARPGSGIEATQKIVRFTASIVVNDQPARIVSGGDDLDFSERQRGKVIRVDLLVSAAFVDSDGDGLPDWWEDQYAPLGFDKYNANDAAGDRNNDGVSNLDEYLDGTDPGREFISYAEWAALHNLTGPNSGPGDDFEGDGVLNVVEFSLDTDPRVVDRAVTEERAHAEIVRQSTRRFLAMHVELPAIRRTGIEYVLEYSIDSVHWRAAVRSEDLGYDLLSRTRRQIRTPLQGRYVRLRILWTEDTQLVADAGIWGLKGNSVRGVARGEPGQASLGVPFDNRLEYQGTATGVASGTLTDSSASWSSTRWTATPHLVTFVSGAALGRSFLISSHTAQELTLQTEGADLTSLVATGDAFEIRPASTLALIFGDPPMSVASGGESTADLVQLWNGTDFDSYFHNGTNWQQAGVDGDRGNTVIFPDDGVFLSNRGRARDQIWFFGRVPSVARAVVLGPGKSYVSHESVRHDRLKDAGLSTLPGWGATDLVGLWTGSAFKDYFFDGAHWRTEGARGVQDRKLLINNSGLFIERAAAASPVTWLQEFR